MKRPAAASAPKGVPDPKRARAAPLSQVPGKFFATRVEDVLKFARRNKHLPKRGSENMEEIRLAGWLNRLQKRNKAKTLSDDERRQLSKIPGMKDRLQRWHGRLLIADFARLLNMT